MRLFGRGRQAGGDKGGSRAQRRVEAEAVVRHLEEFVRTRVGVEAYLEPPTNVTPPTVLLIASDGEWTRRRIPDQDLIRHLAQGLHVPVYDARIVGYPQRMRDWTARRRQRGDAGP